MSNANFNYGLPYVGSKSAIAEWVMAHLPRAKHFYDVFAGGCAITHCAMRMNKYEIYHINDIINTPQFFLNAINGKYQNENNRWVSKMEFYANKENDPIVKYVWSFADNGMYYCYSDDLVPYQQALHKLTTNNNLNPKQKLHLIKNIICEYNKLNKKYSDSTLLIVKSTNTINRINSLQSLKPFVQNIRTYNLDYRELSFEDDAIIYCDPPYHNTDKRMYDKGTKKFNHDEFYEWCELQTQPTFISEYYMPENKFVEIDNVIKFSKASQTKTKHATERIYIPKKQIDLICNLYNKPITNDEKDNNLFKL